MQTAISFPIYVIISTTSMNL